MSTRYMSGESGRLSWSTAGPRSACRRARGPHHRRLILPSCLLVRSGLPTNVTEDQVAQFFGTIGMIKIDKKKRAPKVRRALPPLLGCPAFSLSTQSLPLSHQGG